MDITNDSCNLTLSVVLICLFFHTDFNLPWKIEIGRLIIVMILPKLTVVVSLEMKWHRVINVLGTEARGNVGGATAAAGTAEICRGRHS